MNTHNLKLGSTLKNGSPFICRLMPFIGFKNTLINPFICQKIPSVRNRGVTLIELIIVLTIAGILAALAAPGMQSFVSSNRLSAQVNDLLADINLARSEAIKRSTNAGVCVTDSAGANCVVAGNWVNGWLIYYVCPATDTTCVAGNNVILRVHEALSGKNTLTAPADALIYTKNGMVSAGSGDFTLCDPKMKRTRVLNVQVTGRPALTQGTC